MHCLAYHAWIFLPRCSCASLSGSHCKINMLGQNFIATGCGAGPVDIDVSRPASSVDGIRIACLISGGDRERILCNVFRVQVPVKAYSSILASGKVKGDVNFMIGFKGRSGLQGLSRVEIDRAGHLRIIDVLCTWIAGHCRRRNERRSRGDGGGSGDGVIWRCGYSCGVCWRC